MLRTRSGALAVGVVVHYAAYCIMQTLALLAETRRGPTLPDLILDQFSAQRQWDWVNSQFWLPTLLVAIVLLVVRRPVAALAYLRVGAAVSLLRGLFIVATSLGPPGALRSAATTAGFQALTWEQITPGLLLRHWFPIDALWGGTGLSAVHLTQDLFFSGHTASTFLLFLCLERRDPWRWPMLGFHLVSVFFVIAAHEHYTIDILGAYFVVYATYVWFERRGWLRARFARSHASSMP